MSYINEVGKYAVKAVYSSTRELSEVSTYVRQAIAKYNLNLNVGEIVSNLSTSDLNAILALSAIPLAFLTARGAKKASKKDFHLRPSPDVNIEKMGSRIKEGIEDVVY